MPVTVEKPAAKSSQKPQRKNPPPQLSRQRKPADLSLEQWQTLLRRQFGRAQKFRLQITAGTPPFAEFRITNPLTHARYRVAIRGSRPGDNFCSCPDFATNTLGTCKHIEFTLARLERRRDTRAQLHAGFTQAQSEVTLTYGAQRQVRFLVGTACPPALAVLAADYFGPDRTLRPDAFARFDQFLNQTARFDHDLRCHEDALAFIAEVRDAAHRKRIIDDAFPKGPDSPLFDNLLNADLYDYQRRGALFAARAGRSLIGDEMGLGKTIQAIAAVEIMARFFNVARVLIVCPTSLKHQWQLEIGKFSKRSANVISGLRPAREKAYAENTFFKITNYDTIHADLDLIARASPDLVILDEAQRIKNWNTRTARSVKRIQSPYAIVLTGTPLENRLEELVSLIDFVDRHRLGPTFRFLADHQTLDEQTGRVIGYRDLDSINKTLEPILLRRHKKEVLKQLPARLDKNFFVRMTPQQMQHHEENREIVARIASKWRTYHFLSESDQRRLMIALQNMRMCCNSTYLLDQSTDFGTKADETATLIDELLETPDTKVVIFSQWQRTHELLERRLKSRPHGFLHFNGSIPGHKRGPLIDRFCNDPNSRIFLSTDAGGVGLNLQHASVVINMDLPWNPAVLEQRIGRVHRMGQNRPVQVINFIAQGTIEEGMLSVLQFKKSLFAGVLDGGENQVFLGGSRLTKFMESVENTTSNIPTPTAEEPITPEPPEPRAAESETPSETAAPPARPTTPVNPWTNLLQTGLAFLQQLSSNAGGPPDATQKSLTVASLVRRDSTTGENYLHLPVPKPEALTQFLAAAGELLKQLSK